MKQHKVFDPLPVWNVFCYKESVVTSIFAVFTVIISATTIKQFCLWTCLYFIFKKKIILLFLVLRCLL